MKRILGTLVAAVCLSTAPAFSQDIGDIQDGANALVDTLAVALPFNTNIGLNWSDAYIGQLVGIPPHFGVGVAVGATTVEAGKIGDLLSLIGYDLDLPAGLGNSLPLPAAVFEARIGGFLLPFDIGVKAGYIPESTGESIADAAGGLNVDYLLVGADLRYAILKGNLLMPRLSVGIGFNYMKGGLGTSIGQNQTYNFTAPKPEDPNLNDLYTISATAPDVGLTWETTVIDLKAQISKGLLIFTPYLGVGASYGMTTVGYGIESDIIYRKNGADMLGNIADLEDALTAAGYDVPELSDTGISYEKSIENWAFRAFGGVSINLLVIRLDVSGLYNFSDNQFGGSVGLRFQL